jgi:hypothetical protein
MFREVNKVPKYISDEKMMRSKVISNIVGAYVSSTAKCIKSLPISEQELGDKIAVLLYEVVDKFFPGRPDDPELNAFGRNILDHIYLGGEWPETRESAWTAEER